MMYSGFTQMVKLFIDNQDNALNQAEMFINTYIQTKEFKQVALDMIAYNRQVMKSNREFLDKLNSISTTPSV